MNRPCIIAASRPWYKGIEQRLADKLERPFILVQEKDALEASWLAQINPEYLFCLHWSWMIPKAIWEQYETIIFHMTDVPYGRGGSPLQNLISRGHSDTVLSALRCSSGLDDGPVYLKEPLSLAGSAEEIFLRAIPVMEKMIEQIINEKIQPHPQSGEIVVFKRRTREESNIANITDIQKLYDHIRMLDADGYPRAFSCRGSFRFEFSNATLHNGRLAANVNITLAETKEK